MYKEIIYPICFSLFMNIILLFVFPIVLINVFIGFSLIILCIIYQSFLVFPIVFSVFNEKKYFELNELMKEKNIKEKFISYNNYSKKFWRI